MKYDFFKYVGTFQWQSAIKNILNTEKVKWHSIYWTPLIFYPNIHTDNTFALNESFITVINNKISMKVCAILMYFLSEKKCIFGHKKW